MSEEMRVVIAGAGRVGMRAARLLSDRGHDVAVVESRPDRCEEIGEEGIVRVYEGDASRPGVLRQALEGGVDALAALTGHGATNLAVCMLAGRILGDRGEGVRTVARIEEEEAEEYGEMVDAVVYPARSGGRMAANAIVGAPVEALEQAMGALEILEVDVAEDAPVAGRKLADVQLPAGSLVISDRGGHQVATAGMTLHAGERYVVATEPDVTREVLNLFRG